MQASLRLWAPPYSPSGMISVNESDTDLEPGTVLLMRLESKPCWFDLRTAIVNARRQYPVCPLVMTLRYRPDCVQCE